MSIKTTQLIEEAHILKEKFADRAAFYDESAMLPEENIRDLKNAFFLSMTVSERVGGHGLTLVPMLEILTTLAEGDAPTALSFGWHAGYCLELSEDSISPKTEKLLTTIAKEQVLLNLAQTEKATGSPARGGAPTVSAARRDSGWVINGTKTFTSFAKALDYAVISATVKETGEKGFFVIDMTKPGVTIEETWDSVSMRATRSDDLVLTDVFVEEDALLKTEALTSPKPRGWYLLVPAVYLGVAKAARAYAKEFANSYQPSTLPHPIAEVPEVQRKFGEIELALFEAETLLHATARKWEETDLQSRDDLRGDLGATKKIVTEKANIIVDLAMKVVGAKSLSQSCPLQRHFRDVRAGLHNPPAEDLVISQLGKNILK
ncbi:acyl-CoA/acyl-ACP dehydrogenase [Paenalkalicoccus suaedae]|uniref:Acyl-CoA/acyl-ACP dehydrogenase n=1 Tax=Paenalkalicoccus suaedae TaxID=2592382 RepID=A0A859FEC3_9BACI|nr:acyl-CoA dehydrogenase family protein [Paenalkalicoccus suaedae]QKS71198.1 acyl-CoA/acyl-ACP dehydrogenase [Paenalkalicoccus suaedae]